jgi:aminopeptidase N
VHIRWCLLVCSLLLCIIAGSHNTDTRSDSIGIIHTDLAIDVSDFSAGVLHGKAAITFAAKVNGINSIRLDLLRLTVDSVKAGSRPLAYTYNDSQIAISLPAALMISQQQTITVFYHGKPLHMQGDFGGFYWNDLYAFNIGISFLAVPHNFGKAWFPCFDNFVARSAFHFAITTDPTRRAMCNGHPDSVTTSADGNKVWYWTMPESIPAYLASMSVSDYSVLTYSYNGLKGPLPILLAARGQDTANLKKSFVHLKNALAIYEKCFGPYEFDRVGYCLVPFRAGAMEHATNISYMEALANGTTAYENVMAHELSHHWFGDMVTIDDEGEMWLQEGWATYCEDLFYEGMYGKGMYKDKVRTMHEDVVRMAHISDKAYWALSGIPASLTYSNRTIYEQGADRVHTLRGYMGDSLFFACMRGYLQQYKWRPVNSYILRDYLKSSSGLHDIDDFFADWIFSGGFPDFSIEHTQITAIGSSYQVTIAIRQRSDHAPHLYHHVPLEVAYFDAKGHKTVLVADVSDSSTQFTAMLPFYPAYIALDFDEKISDAVTDYWVKMAGNHHQYDMGVAKMTIGLAHSRDSSLVRVEHHFVAPDAAKNTIAGLHLSGYRYWMVDGIWSRDFVASAIICYDGSTGQDGYLDNTLITGNEDKLVLAYRADAGSSWQIDRDIALNMGADHTDKIGTIRINHLRKGQYALAIYDANK